MANVKTWELYNGSAGLYDRFRPDYPSEIFALARCFHGRDVPAKRAADIGCGTGIFTRQLAAALPSLVQIDCLEANPEMAAIAQEHASAFPVISVAVGMAEDIPFADRSVDLVTAATAANWFDRPIFYREAARILRPRGTLLIVQNKHRYWDSPFLADFADFQERNIPGYERGRYSDFTGGYGRADFFAELQEHAAYTRQERHRVDWRQILTPSEFCGYCYSMGHIKKAVTNRGEDRIAAELQILIDRHVGDDGTLSVDWLADLVLAEVLD